MTTTPGQKGHLRGAAAALFLATVAAYSLGASQTIAIACFDPPAGSFQGSENGGNEVTITVDCPLAEVGYVKFYNTNIMSFTTELPNFVKFIVPAKGGFDPWTNLDVTVFNTTLPERDWSNTLIYTYLPQPLFTRIETLPYDVDDTTVPKETRTYYGAPNYSITILGSGFPPDIAEIDVKFGSTSGTVTQANSSTIRVTTPPGLLGNTDRVTVFVYPLDDHARMEATDGFFTDYKYIPAEPTFSSINPDWDWFAGGATATITGTNFYASYTQVYFNGVPVSYKDVQPSHTEMWVTVPPNESSIEGNAILKVEHVVTTEGDTRVNVFYYKDAKPEVTFASPQSGANLSETVQLQADAIDDSGISEVEFWYHAGSDPTYSSPSNPTGDWDPQSDAAWLAEWTLLGDDEDDTWPYKYDWDTTDLLGQQVHLIAVAYDDHTPTAGINANGNQTDVSDSYASVNITDPASADNPPSVTMLAPKQDAIVSITSGDVTLSAEVIDDKGVDSVTFLVDGVEVGTGERESGTDVWSFDWDGTDDGAGGTPVAEGWHQIEVEALDTIGQRGSDGVAVYVTLDTVPVLTIESPSAGTVSGTVTITVTVTDDSASIASAEYEIRDGDGATVVGPVAIDAADIVYDGATGTVTASWDTTDGSTPNGDYTFIVRVTDSVGNVAEATVDVTVDQSATTTTPTDDGCGGDDDGGGCGSPGSGARPVGWMLLAAAVMAVVRFRRLRVVRPV